MANEANEKYGEMSPNSWILGFGYFSTNKHKDFMKKLIGYFNMFLMWKMKAYVPNSTKGIILVN